MQMLYGMYVCSSGILRSIYLLFITIVYLIPAGFAWIHGHGRFGKTGVFDTLDLNQPNVVVFWVLSLTWFFYPLIATLVVIMRDSFKSK